MTPCLPILQWVVQQYRNKIFQRLHFGSLFVLEALQGIQFICVIWPVFFKEFNAAVSFLNLYCDIFATIP